MSGFSLEHLDVVRFYLFGDVKFLHLLLVLMVLDVITGIFVLVPPGLAEKLKVVESQRVKSSSFKKIIGEELAGSKVDKQLEDAKEGEK